MRFEFTREQLITQVCAEEKGKQGEKGKLGRKWEAQGAGGRMQTKEPRISNGCEYIAVINFAKNPKGG